jgi:DNA-binding IclR family transcriptional regulator
MDRIERVLNILNYLASSRKPCGVTEISKKFHIDKSSVSRVLSSLERQKWVFQLPDKTYDLGNKPLEFGLSVLSRVELRKVSKQHLIELNDITNETVGLGFRLGFEEMYLDQAECKHVVRAVIELGIKSPIWRGATGKAMLAYMDKSEVDEVIDHLSKSDERVLASGKILEIDKLLEQLSEIRRQGFAVSVGERATGATNVASPIFDHNNKVIGNISITGPLPRFNEEIARGFGPQVKQASQSISMKLGSNHRF